MTTSIELTSKQFWQVYSIAEETQSYLPFKEVSVFKMTDIVARYCNCCLPDIKDLKENLLKFRNKYYSIGFKPNKYLSDDQRTQVLAYRKPRFILGINLYKPANPIEKIAFIRALRACRDYIRSGFSDDAFNVLVKKLDNITLLIH